MSVTVTGEPVFNPLIARRQWVMVAGESVFNLLNRQVDVGDGDG